MASAGSDRAFVWNVQADFADEQPKPEQLAIRFKNAESKFVSVSGMECSGQVVFDYLFLFLQMLENLRMLLRSIRMKDQ